MTNSPALKPGKATKLAAVGLAAGLALITSFAVWLPLCHRLDNQACDLQCRIRLRLGFLPPASDQVVLCLLTQDDVHRLKKPGQKFSIRRVLPRLIDNLADGGATAIGLDVWLVGQTTAAVDAELVRACENANVVLAAAYTGGRAIRPFSALGAAAPEGLIAVSHDSDGILRRIPSPAYLDVVEPSGDITRLGYFGAVLCYLHTVEDPEQSPLLIGPEQTSFLDYRLGYGKRLSFPVPRTPGGFQTISFSDACRKPPSGIDGKMVIVGEARSLADRHYLPNAGASQPGGVFHACVIHNLLMDGFIDEAPPSVKAVLTAMFSLLGAVVFWRLRTSVLWKLPVGFVLMIGVVVGAEWMLLWRQYWPGVAGPLAGIGAELVAGIVFQTVILRRYSHRIEGWFGRYVSPEVLRRIQADPSGLDRPTPRDATILFSDLRGFTALSEATEPAALMTMLNDYFERMVAAAFEHEGFVDKFVGDAIMIVFGVPLPQSDHARRALLTARAMKKALAEFNAARTARGEKPIDAGIGIHSGRVVAGNLGGKRRAGFTVIGDTVNVAARIEGLAKNGETFISEALLPAAAGLFETRSRKTVSLKGKTGQFPIYEVL